ncbi:hypothetical protein [Planomonospora parontospora]|uniref:hypothetical protein n=1 Tax=Planomonospora parontospora TaxID=58119 RepID=UPI00166FCE9F|nr:hypothetical protein [Planomonospora parontospora]
MSRMSLGMTIWPRSPTFAVPASFPGGGGGVNSAPCAPVPIFHTFPTVRAEFSARPRAFERTAAGPSLDICGFSLDLSYRYLPDLRFATSIPWIAARRFSFEVADFREGQPQVRVRVMPLPELNTHLGVTFTMTPDPVTERVVSDVGVEQLLSEDVRLAKPTANVAVEHAELRIAIDHGDVTAPSEIADDPGQIDSLGKEHDIRNRMERITQAQQDPGGRDVASQPLPSMPGPTETNRD